MSFVNAAINCIAFTVSIKFVINTPWICSKCHESNCRIKFFDAFQRYEHPYVFIARGSQKLLHEK